MLFFLALIVFFRLPYCWTKFLNAMLLIYSLNDSIIAKIRNPLQYIIRDFEPENTYWKLSFTIKNGLWYEKFCGDNNDGDFCKHANIGKSSQRAYGKSWCNFTGLKNLSRETIPFKNPNQGLYNQALRWGLSCTFDMYCHPGTGSARTSTFLLY